MTTFRSRFGQIFSVVTWVVLGAAQAPLVVPFDGVGLVRSIPLTATLALAVWAAFWRPVLLVSDDGIVIRNVVTEFTIPWGAVQQIDTKWGLTVFTSIGRITAWAAPAPGRHSSFTASRDQGQFLPESTYLNGTIRPGDLATSESGAAAAHIRRIWETRRDEVGIATKKFDGRLITVFAVLVVATALSLGL